MKLDNSNKEVMNVSDENITLTDKDPSKDITLEGVTSGTAALTLSAKGYDAITQQITVDTGGAISISNISPLRQDDGGYAIVSLDAAPTTPIKITMKSSDPKKVIVVPETFELTSSNFKTPTRDKEFVNLYFQT